MGKLAERFTDATRSGVYRVRAAGIPRAAAGEARARLLEIGAAALADGGWPQLARALGESDRDICVVLVSDAAGLGAHIHDKLVTALGATAQACREAGRPFFAVLVDPDQRLELPLLYHEKPDA